MALSVADQPSESKTRELVSTVGEASLAAIPLLGGPLAAAFAALMSVPLARRREAWLTELAQAVEDLQDDFAELRPENLSTNADFLDAVVTASRLAEGTHAQEKIDALRYACVNSAIPGGPDADTRSIFFRYVGDFTPTHLRLLALLREPAAWFDAHGIGKPAIYAGARAGIVETGLPELAGRRALYDLFVSDLSAAGLLIIDSVHGLQTGDSLWNSCTSDLGAAFLDFIREPRPESSAEG